jgi:hypothetical protein
MTVSESVAAVEYTIRARFDEICQRLQESDLRDRLDKPIGYWALTADRRLPYALLERKVGDLIATPFKELARTPAIGKKKLASLVTLLERVRIDQKPSTLSADPLLSIAESSNEQLELDAVSESHWEAWRESVRSHHLANEPLGRFAPTLRSLPTVIWDSPLSTYVDMPLAQLRRMKTHGDKRVRNVLEVFYFIHQVLKSASAPRHLVVQLRPSFTIPMEQWVVDVLRRDGAPSLQELRQGLVLPLLNQIEADSDETIGRLVAGRLGVESAPESAIEQADRLNVTRARVYQLLEQAARIMRVRWPEGGWQLLALDDHWSSLPQEDERRQMLRALRAILYPQRLRTEVLKPEPLAATPA